MIKLTIVRGLVNHNGRYLFLKKAKDIVQENIGKWECPGGKIHDNEVPKQTLLREVEEETGLKCEIVKALPSLQANAKQITSKCFIYLLKAETDKVRLSPEHTEYKWIEPEKVKELPLVLFADLLLKYFNNPKKYLE